MTTWIELHEDKYRTGPQTLTYDEGYKRIDWSKKDGNTKDKESLHKPTPSPPTDRIGDNRQGDYV